MRWVSLGFFIDSGNNFVFSGSGSKFFLNFAENYSDYSENVLGVLAINPSMPEASLYKGSGTSEMKT